MTNSIDRYGDLRPYLANRVHRQSFSYHPSLDVNTTKSEYDKMVEKVQAISLEIKDSDIISLREALKIDPEDIKEIKK